jgi:hypothetical protein
VHVVHVDSSRVENSDKGLSCQLKFDHGFLNDGLSLRVRVPPLAQGEGKRREKVVE